AATAGAIRVARGAGVNEAVSPPLEEHPATSPSAAVMTTPAHVRTAGLPRRLNVASPGVE
ncbi:hypothetical protein, partial [Frankia sp. KB5]|uniref:hypothetical protein n=1 Tax=Frankia sp. KB5 TaxID=683318 RepID=UPI001A7E0444